MRFVREDSSSLERVEEQLISLIEINNQAAEMISKLGLAKYYQAEEIKNEKKFNLPALEMQSHGVNEAFDKFKKLRTPVNGGGTGMDSINQQYRDLIMKVKNINSQSKIKMKAFKPRTFDRTSSMGSNLSDPATQPSDMITKF